MKRLLLACLMAAPSLIFGIVSIKPVDVGERPSGFSGDFALALSADSGNSETGSIDAGATLQYDANRSVSFATGSYKYGEAKKIANVDKSFLHLRNICAITSHIDWETFAQRQSNAFQSLTSRWLAGGGGRISGRLTSIGAAAYLGVGAFYAQEIETALAARAFGRANIYLSYKQAPGDSFTLALVGYYQPRLDDPRDYLLLTTAQIELKIDKRFALTVTLSYTVDSQPPSGVSPYDYSQETALKYMF